MSDFELVFLYNWGGKIGEKNLFREYRTPWMIPRPKKPEFQIHSFNVTQNTSYPLKKYS